MKNILVATNATFPTGEAMSVQIMRICLILQKLGYNVILLADRVSTKLENVEKHGYYMGIEYYYLGNSFDLKKRIINIVSYKKKLNEIKKLCKFDFIIMNSIADRFFFIYETLKSFFCPLVIISCEWYSCNSWRYGFLNPFYWIFLLNWNLYFCKVDGVIAVSTLLKKHYDNMQIKTLLIPTLVDINKNIKHIHYGSKIKLIFAGGFGTTGKKDNIGVLIDALWFLQKDEITRFKFTILGPSKNEVYSQVKNSDALDWFISNNIIDIKGKIEQTGVLDYIKENDFSVFFRPNNRSSNAGFSTKLGEAFSVGTSVITNDTGDIAQYVKDGVNGFIVANTNVGEIFKLLKKLLILRNEDINRLCMNARDTAYNHFYYANYINPVDNFLKNLSLKS